MMKRLIFTGALLLASVVTGEAMASCGGLYTKVTSLVAKLTNNKTALGMTLCSATGQGTQEEHHWTSGTSGELWDFKCGPSGYAATAPGTACAKPDSDRRSKLGTWSVTGDTTSSATVTYNYTAYGSSTQGPFVLYQKGTLYDICTTTGTVVGTFTLAVTTGTSRVCP